MTVKTSPFSARKGSLVQLMSRLVVLSIPIEGNEPPSEFRIFKKGANVSSKGTVYFDDFSAESVMMKFRDQGNVLFIDRDHKSLNPFSPPDAGEAQAYFEPDVRLGDLWSVKLDWTPDGAESMRKRKWKFFSPAFLTDKEGRVVELINVALTNMPALKRLEPLVANILSVFENEDVDDPSQEKTIMSLPVLSLAILSALALSPQATEVEALNAIEHKKKNERELLSLTGASSPEEALGKVRAFKASHDELDATRVKLSKAEGDLTKRDLDALIEQGKKDKKLTPALETWARTQPISAVKAFLESAPTISALSNDGVKPPPGPGSDNPAAAVERKWEELTPVQKHNLYFNDRAKYEALKNDAEKRASAAA